MEIKKYWWAGVAFLGSFAWLVGQGLEVYGKWPACRLCHVERWIFLAMGLMAFLRIFMKVLRRSKGWSNFLGGGVILLCLMGSGVAGYHTALQFHWIALPSFCQLPTADTLEQFMALPSATCDQWTLSFLYLPLPLYLCVGWLVLALGSARFLKSPPRGPSRQSYL